MLGAQLPARFTLLALALMFKKASRWSLCFHLNSSTYLYDQGSGLVYDDAFNIIGLQDTNYTQTSGCPAEYAIGSYPQKPHISAIPVCY